MAIRAIVLALMIPFAVSMVTCGIHKVHQATPTGATFYMSPTGNDSNPGTSSALWATPNHALNCGDVIIAASGTYPPLRTFGPVSCVVGNNVAWLKCAVFDSCRIEANEGNGIEVGTSFWGVQGWEVTTAPEAYACFSAVPATASETIHHIIFANNVANGCGGGGVQSSDNGVMGVDYFAVVGNITYDGAQNPRLCFSGISSYLPVASDLLPGTHYYFAGNFTFDNVEPNRCNNEVPTDGDGLIFDVAGSYTQQMVMDNNISIFNGGRGVIAAYDNGSSTTPRYIRHNTIYGNNTQSVQRAGSCGELVFWETLGSQAYQNLAVVSGPSACHDQAWYLYEVDGANSSDSIYSNFGFSPSGNNVQVLDASPGFSFGTTNIFGVDPKLANPVNPEAPECAGYAGVPQCMASVIANFRPTSPAAQGYGYQIPGSTAIGDPLFPQWLCNVNLPPGLVTLTCQAQSPGNAALKKHR